MNYEQIMVALRNAHAAGDTAAATRLAAMARAAQANAPAVDPAQPVVAPQQAPQERGIGAAIYDNIVGSDDGVQSYGESLGSLVRGAGAASARGLADVPALPVNIAQLGTMGVEKALGMEEPSMVSRGLNSLPDTRDILSSIPVIGPESEYQAPGMAGEFVGTAGEFAGAAGGTGGIINRLASPQGGLSTASNMIRYGVVPGVASEAAGQLTDGTSLEPYARTTAGVVASLLAGPRPGAFSSSTEPGKMANHLQENGVRGVTAGQAKGSQPLMSAEGRLQATSQQIDDFTSATMRQLGSADDLATPESLRAVESVIVGQMDDAVRGVSVVPDASAATRALAISDDYAARAPQVSLTPRVRGIAEEMRSLAVSRQPVSLDQIKTWRSDIGRITTSNDAATRDAAHGLRSLMDDMTDTALTNAGRADDIANLASARESYRNFIGVRDAASRAGAEGGTLSPQALNQSMIRSQGREAYATGRTTPMADFTRAGAAVLRPASTVNAGGVRSIMGALPLASASVLGGGALQAGVSPVVAGILAAGGALAPEAGRAAMRSNLAQTVMRSPMRAASQPLPTIPGLLSASE